ncbi:MAG: PilZ domain-containing protein [Proteobacteria bacterium]|nr:PilZ domain-containing protein [Pseudomonadota bacterium]
MGAIIATLFHAEVSPMPCSTPELAEQGQVLDVRQAHRTDHGEPVALLVSGGKAIGFLQNISVTGALIVQGEGDLPSVDASVSLRLFDGRHLHGSVVRIEGRYLGIKFDPELASVNEIVCFESREADVCRAMVTYAHRRGQ